MFASAIKLAKLTATLSRGSQRLVRAQQHGMFPLSSRHRCSHKITCPNRQLQEKVLAKSKKKPLWMRIMSYARPQPLNGMEEADVSTSANKLTDAS